MSESTMRKKNNFAGRAAGIVLCLIICVTAAFACACEKNGGRDGENTSEPGGAAESENIGGQPDVAVGDDDNPDEVFATTTAIAYPLEIRAQLDSFHELASQLSLDDVPSAAELLTAYRDLVLEGPVNDALFFAYEEYMQFVCEGLNSVYEEEPPEDATINDALENGFLFISDDDYSAYFILRPDFLKDTFTETVSERVQSFLNLSAKHYNFHSGYDFIENETLMVTLDQLAEMIVDWENYIRLYPDASNRQDIEMNLDYYLKIYVGSIQIENSGLYVLAGMDENGETLYKLMDETRQSYLKFIENYPDAAACPLITELYQIYSDDNFLYSVKVEDFFRKYNLAYDI